MRKAKRNDTYALGVISAYPAFLADIGEMRWKNKNQKDYHENKLL